MGVTGNIMEGEPSRDLSNDRECESGGVWIGRCQSDVLKSMNIVGPEVPSPFFFQ